MPPGQRPYLDRLFRLAAPVPSQPKLTMPAREAGKDAAFHARATLAELIGKSRRDSSIVARVHIAFAR